VMSLTQAANRQRISRASLCRLVHEFETEKKTSVQHVGNQKRAVPFVEANNSHAASQSAHQTLAT